MELGKRIKEARKARKWTQKDLAEACGWHEGQTRVSNYETGFREPTLADIQRMEEALGLMRGALTAGDLVSDNWTRDLRAPYVANVEPGPTLRSSVPLISWVQAGNWCAIVDNFQPGDADEWIPTTKKVSTYAYALRVRGDSMENPRGMPTFPDGCIIIVDPSRAADPGRFVVARLDDTAEATFKQLVEDAGRRYLKPLNPQYDMLPVTKTTSLCGVWVQTIIDSD
jgi:SOS-response transcriptional repressor LexA